MSKAESGDRKVIKFEQLWHRRPQDLGLGKIGLGFTGTAGRHCSQVHTGTAPVCERGR